MSDIYRLSDTDLESFFRTKYGDPDSTGWSPKRRFKHGYYLAGDIYEVLVSKLVSGKSDWIDVGGGSALFPNNIKLSSQLAEKCRSLVAVDPSENVKDNPYCDFAEMCRFEDLSIQRKFNLATFRMVAEHVDDPVSVLEKLNELITPGGLVVIYTVNKYCPIPIVTRLTPFSLHFKIKKVIWGGEEKNTFPVTYLMNTRKTLSKFFAEYGFVEDDFRYLDDLSVFIKYNIISHLELLLWRCLKKLNLRYPEHNILAVYRKLAD